MGENFKIKTLKNFKTAEIRSFSYLCTLFKDYVYYEQRIRQLETENGDLKMTLVELEREKCETKITLKEQNKQDHKNRETKLVKLKKNEQRFKKHIEELCNKVTELKNSLLELKDEARQLKSDRGKFFIVLTPVARRLDKMVILDNSFTFRSLQSRI